MRESVLVGNLSMYRFRIAAALSGALFALMLAFAPAAGAIGVGGPSDCDTNAVIKCGAHSTSSLIADYNSSAYVRGVYAYFGISAKDINSLPGNDVAGYVTKDGNVFINGQSRAVAKNAITGGREYIQGSTRVNHQGAILYVRPPSVSFQQNSLPAFVVMKNGIFQFAIIASCGNPVKAIPTPKTVTPAPAKPVKTPTVRTAPPKAPAAPPSQQQTQTQNQSVNITNTNTQNVTTASPSQPQTAPQAQTSAQPAAQPSSLVDTGATGTVGVFLATVGLGTLAYRRFILRRMAG